MNHHRGKKGVGVLFPRHCHCHYKYNSGAEYLIKSGQRWRASLCFCFLMLQSFSGCGSQCGHILKQFFWRNFLCDPPLKFFIEHKEFDCYKDFWWWIIFFCESNSLLSRLLAQRVIKFLQQFWSHWENYQIKNHLNGNTSRRKFWRVRSGQILVFSYVIHQLVIHRALPRIPTPNISKYLIYLPNTDWICKTKNFT